MEHALQRKRGRFTLLVLLAAQFLLLAYQLRRPNQGGVRVTQLWATEAVLPLERSARHLANTWTEWRHSYLALRDVGSQNAGLRAQVAQLQLQNQQLRESVRELPQLDALLGFQRAFAVRTQAAAVISYGASADAQTLFLDRGRASGLERNQPVITPQGVVGKLTQVLASSAQVLLITDPDSGVGALVGASGIHGILRGGGAGRATVRNILKDEPVKVGDAVVTSGDDQVFAKGLTLGVVTRVIPSQDGVFQSADVRLAADMGRIEDVLVVTGTVPLPAVAVPATGADTTTSRTAADVRQALLPGLSAPAAGILPGSSAAGANAEPPPLPDQQPHAKKPPAAATNTKPGGNGNG